MSAKAAARAAQVTLQTSTAALDFAKAQEAERKREYNQQQASLKLAWDAEQARKAPFRAIADGLIRRAAAKRGITLPAAAATSSVPPAGWVPGSSSGSSSTSPTSLASLATLGRSYGNSATSPLVAPVTTPSLWGSVAGIYDSPKTPLWAGGSLAGLYKSGRG